MAHLIKAASAKSALAGFTALVAATAVMLTVAAPADAQRNRDRDERSEEEQANRTLSSRVGQSVQTAVEQQDEEDWAGMISTLTPLIDTELTAYERSIVLRLRATAYYNQDNLQQATRDFLGVLETGALVQEEANTLRINVGQLYMAQENVNEGIRQFELAIENGATLNTRLAKMLATAYAQADRYADGLRYAEQFYRDASDKTVNDFNLMQFYYNQLDRPEDELRVIRDALSAYPGERRSWQNLVSMFARLDREEDAFEANKLMYLNGLFEECEEVYRLAQYYSAFDNPYRGGRILERAINAGRCEGDVEQLERLGNMWRQAAEFDLAIPVVERLARETGSSEWSLRLAEAHYQLNNYAEAEPAFVEAIDRGGLSSRENGDAWVLLGTARFQQGNLQQALQAFREGRNFPSARVQANGWIEFVNSQIEGVERRTCQREQVQLDECRLTIDAERRQLVLIGEVNEDGEVSFPEGSIPERCSTWFDTDTGEQFRDACISDEEAEQARADQGAQAEG